jgi:tetratricopeptide (TPR) repeat protein
LGRSNYIIFGIFLILGSVLSLWFSRCTSDSKASPYKNVLNKQAQYIGMAKCSTCHADKYNTYTQTGMEKSGGFAKKEKSAALFDEAHTHVYDKKNDLHYKPFWQGDSLRIMEYRLLNGDTTHKRIETVQYIIGSGQHTNSHIINSNGYLHQAPITFYTQKQKWDLAPGFEHDNTRFDRKIETECITCHNGYPEQVEGSINKYSSVKLGIDCERCHGPGSLHAEAMLAGKLIDTAKQPDYSIVHPGRLSIDQQNNLCMRCHLQGVSALNDGKSFFDFEPSLNLKDYWQVFLPEHTQGNKMIMASHVERMQMSKCYTNSKQMSCITCHNPHISVSATPARQFNSACINCHSTNKQTKCTEQQIARNKNSDNCYECHMSKNESVDIPHVSVHDHRIVKHIGAEQNKNAIDAFVQLKCYNNCNPSARSKARGYLEFYERYANNKALLDSAALFLDSDKQQIEIQNVDLIRLAFLQNNYSKVTTLAEKFSADKIKEHWNAYRIGEAFSKLNNQQQAELYLSQACKLCKYNLDYQQKLATCYITQSKFDKAIEVLQFINKENPKLGKAQVDLGFLAQRKGDWQSSIKFAQTALILEPDNVQNLINLSVAYYNTNQQQKIKPLLTHALHLQPQNAQVQAMLNDIK